MDGLAAIGVGCRRDCPSAPIVALVRRALLEAGELPSVRRLFTLAVKCEERGLIEAAEALGLELAPLSYDDLAAAEPRLLTRSDAVLRRFGLPCLSEAAALAGAGSSAKLLGPRIVGAGATCAIAVRPSAEGAT